MTSKTWYTAYGKRYYLAFRAYCWAALGGKCAVCGATEHLEIDHIDPTTKCYNVMKMLRMDKQLVDAELRKCQLLCKKHHQDKTGRARHGTGGMYRNQKCRCELCVATNAAYARAHRLRNKPK